MPRKMRKSSQHYTEKTRGNYPSGGWCRWRGRCRNFPGQCAVCFREDCLLVVLSDDEMAAREDELQPWEQ